MIGHEMNRPTVLVPRLIPHPYLHPVKRYLASLLLLPALIAPALAAPGDLDLTFGAGKGFATTSFNGTGLTVGGLVVQPDGKILVGAVELADSNLTLMRFSSNGTLDADFGAGGKVKSPLGTSSIPARIVMPGNGTFVVVGQILPDFSSSQSMFAARFSGNGTLDPTFDGDGLAFTSVGGSSNTGSDGLVQPDGKVVVVGSLYLSPSDSDFVAVRFSTNGTLDPDFGTNGRVQLNLGNGFPSGGSNDNCAAVGRQSDGRLVLGGSMHNNDFALARLTSNGTLDPTFGTAGVVRTDVTGRGDNGSAVAIQSDDKILLAGTCFGSQFGLVRYTAAGALDSTFGTDGVVLTESGKSLAYVTGVVVDSTGRILVSGYTNDGYQTAGNLVIFRYTAAGVLDSTFGTGGKVTTGPGTTTDDLQRLALQPDGRILAAGSAAGETGQVNFALTRYTVALDPPNQAPVVTLTGPKKLTVKTAAVTIKGTAKDDARVSRVLVKGTTGAARAAAGTTSWSCRLALKPGTNKFTITAVDAAGLVSRPVTLTIDRK